MVVRCEVKMCPYYNNGWCCNKVLAITPQGACGTVYDKRGNWKNIQMNIAPQFKEKIRIEEA